MSRLAEALVGWLVIVGMVFGGAGVLLLALSTIRSLVPVALARRFRMAPPETKGIGSEELRGHVPVIVR